MNKKSIFKEYKEQFELVNEIIEIIHKDEKIKGILDEFDERIILFDVKDDADEYLVSFYIQIDEGTLDLVFEDPDQLSKQVDATVSASVEILLQLLSGKQNPLRAYSLGKITASGSFTAAQEVLEVFQMAYEVRKV